VVADLRTNWPAQVLDRFYSRLEFKLKLLEEHPNLGFKSGKYSRFRKTLITRHYMLIYSVRQKHIIMLRVKHTKLK